MHWIKHEMHREIIAEPLVRLPSYLYSASRRPARDLLRVRVGRLAGPGEVEPPATAAPGPRPRPAAGEARAFGAALAAHSPAGGGGRDAPKLDRRS